MHWTLSDLVADISQNSCESGADTVELSVSETETEFRFVVQDNGKGMTPDTLQRALDPFVTDGIKHPHRKVGLGLPFLVQTAEQSGGGWHIDSHPGTGTTVTAWFDAQNVDMPPVGDVPGMIRTVLLFPGPTEIGIRRLLSTGAHTVKWEVRKTELLDILGDFEDTQSLILLDQYLRSQEENYSQEEDL
jgi:hypothetical protein